MSKALIAVLASGAGTTAEALIRASIECTLGFEVGLVISSSETAGVLGRVDKVNHEYGCRVAMASIGPRTHPRSDGEPFRPGLQTTAEAAAIAQLLTAGSFETVVLMGYLRRVDPSLVHQFGWREGYGSHFDARMLNTHPGLLPETKGLYGVAVQEFVLNRGLSEAGHVIHVVAEEYDEGPVLFEHRTPVLPDDTPAETVGTDQGTAESRHSTGHRRVHCPAWQLSRRRDPAERGSDRRVRREATSWL